MRARAEQSRSRERERGVRAEQSRHTERERERERERCAGKERPRARADVSFRCIIFSFAQAGYTRSTFNSDTQTVVLVINVRVSVLNVHLVYKKRFRGPLAFGGPRQPPTFA